MESSMPREILFPKKSSEPAVDVVEKAFRIYEDVGRIIGCRLFGGGSCLSLRIVAFLFLLTMYVLGIALLLISIFPHPSESDRSLRFDTPSIFAAMVSFFYINQLAAFICINYANAVLNRKGGFYEQCRESLTKLEMTADDVSMWKKVAVCNSCFSMVMVTITMVLFILYTFLEGLRAGYPVPFDRVVEWTSIPDLAIRVLLNLPGIIGGGIHFPYLASTFAGLCNLVKYQFVFFCKKLEEETAESFSSVQISKYQNQYARLASLTEGLDEAFKHLCTFQLFLFVLTACLNLFCLTQSSGSHPLTIFALIYWLAAMSLIFLRPAAAAISLRAESQRPKALLRHWFLRHEQARMEECRLVEASSRYSLALILQWIASEDVGLTASSLAKFDAPLLLSVASVVVTYFLVIFQFTTSPPVNLGILTNLTHNMSAFCDQFCFPFYKTR